MKQQFDKNRLIPTIFGLGIGIIGILPAYFALDLLIRYHDSFMHDASLLFIVLICSAIALSLFLLGYWVYLKSGRIGLEVHVRPGHVEFTSTTAFGDNNKYIIKWNDVRQVVMTEIPRAGETLYFRAHNIKEPWHDKGLPLKFNQSWADTMFPLFRKSAAKADLELYPTKRLITLFYDRYVWDVRKLTGDDT